jgi:predicted phosphodiesterase
MTCVALLADIHGNSPALQAVLEDIKQAGITCLFVLGDIINGHDPEGCVNLLQAWSGQVKAIRGNAEMYLLTPDLDAFPLRQNPLYTNLIRLLHWFENHLSPANITWLGNLPDTIRWNGAYMVHDSPIDRLYADQHYQPGIDSKYRELMHHSQGIYPNTPMAQIAPILEWMDAKAISHVYIGHTHVPFVAWHGNRLLCNVGSVGLPLDSDPRPTWMQVEISSRTTPVVTIRRIEYEIDTIIEIIDSNMDYPSFKQPGMHQAYIKMLRTGIHWRAHLNEEKP